MPANRRVTRAVGAVLELAPRRGEVSLPRLVQAVSEERARPIDLKMADLPPGVCGQWRQYADRDGFLIQKGLSAWERTLGHELGHLVLHGEDREPHGLTAEQEANRFAAAFLMPRSGVLAQGLRNATAQRILVAKRRWNVAAMAGMLPPSCSPSWRCRPRSSRRC